MKPLERIRALPETTRKIILWTFLVIVAAILLCFLLANFQNKLNNFKAEDLRKDLNIPELEIPELNLPLITEDNGRWE